MKTDVLSAVANANKVRVPTPPLTPKGVHEEDKENDGCTDNQTPVYDMPNTSNGHIRGKVNGVHGFPKIAYGHKPALPGSVNGQDDSQDINRDKSSISGSVNDTTQVELTEVSKKGIRSKSAKRSETSLDSPSSPRNGGQGHHKPLPAKSAPSNRHSSNVRSVKSREGGRSKQDGSLGTPANVVDSNGNCVKTKGGGADGGKVNAPGTRRRSSRRLTSWSDEVSAILDLVSPRSSSSQQQNVLNTTASSSSSSEDVRLQFSPVPAPARPGAPSPVPPHMAHAWDMFEVHVRTIHNSSDMFTRHQGPTFSASSTFHETMVEIYGYPDYAKLPPPTVPSTAARSRYVANCANKFLNIRKRASMVPGGGAAKPVREVSRKTMENAKRGWRILRQHVHEAWVKKRTSAAALSWSMLRQTLIGMSDMDRTRLDLYRRYGIVPTVDSKGNVVMENTMLSERARNAIANGSRHPLLAHANPQQHSSHQPHSHLHPHDKPLSVSLPQSSFSPTFPASRERSQLANRRSPVRPHTSAAVGFGSGLQIRNSTNKKESDFSSKSLTRSHTP